MVKPTIIESWRPVDVPGFEALYSVSDLGRVRSERDGSYRKPGLSREGYPQLGLYADGSKWHGLLAPLVARAFVGPRPTPGHVVGHRDRCRGNCRASNLFWATRREISATSPPPRKLSTDRLAELIALRGRSSTNEAARIYGISVRRVQQIWLDASRTADDDGTAI